MREPVAIVGLGGVFPGAADVESLWSRVVTATPAPVTSQEARWGLSRASYFGSGPERAYMDDAFVLPIEACTLGGSIVDPQVRAGRHAVLAALADARIDHDDVALVAATSWAAPSYFAHDAAQITGTPAPEGPVHAPDAQLAAIGEGLTGPRIAVDTACASSLYALELAAGLLAEGRARAAVVLGLNVLLPPFLYVGFSKLGALSQVGRILPFSADASGIVPGECAAAIVIEPISSARASGRKVQAVVRAIGLAADGAERSIFAPGPRGQALAYSRAWEGLDPTEVDYVEAHGTATTIGDETEIETLDAFFGGRTEKLPIGSIKGLVGHTLAAAGIASIAKVVLALRHETIPPHLEVTTHPRLDATCLSLPAAPMPWRKAANRPRRAGISAFGFGGANAHVILEEDVGQALERTSTPVTLAIVDAAAELELPAQTTIDAAGLRAGPKLLSRVDPLQLLITDLVRQVLARSPQDPERTGVVMTSNLGGATCMKLSRKYLRRFRGMPADAAEPELTIEAIGSSLPTMCSGTPSFHFDLRGFHQTLAGDASSFFTALSLAPHWLDGRCDALLLGGARQRVSPLDRETSEGAAVFLLKRHVENERVLATLTFTDRADAPREVVDLDQGAFGEATGIDALMRVLSGGEPRVVLEIRHRSRVVSTLVVERHHVVEANVPAPKLPLDIVFRDSPKKVVEVQQWIASTSVAVEAHLRAQARILSFLEPVGSFSTPVLADVDIARGVASVVVDERHPYFFDHPLDHVPGILLVEAIAELACAQRGGEPWVRGLDVRFRRFCEMNQPICVELDRQGRGRIVQSGAPVATFSIDVADAPAVRRADDTRGAIPAVDRKLLHKHRDENVLVGPLEGLVSRVRPVPRGHFFDDGRPFFSPLHLLETARQVVMLGAHGVLGIPLGMPMNLLSIALSCTAPATRDGDLRLRLEPRPLRRVEGTMISDVSVAIEESGRPIGTASIKAQVVDVDTYRKQRGMHP